MFNDLNRRRRRCHLITIVVIEEDMHTWLILFLAATRAAKAIANLVGRLGAPVFVVQDERRRRDCRHLTGGRWWR